MALEHEYTLLGGYSRTLVGRWLATLAAAVSSGLVFLLLTLVDVAKQLGFDTRIPPIILSLVGAGAVYSVLYILFNKYVWRIRPLARFLKSPNLSGHWRCEGIRLDLKPPQPWTGEVKIVQSWDRIRVHLETATSESDSLAAALQHDAAVGYRLMYHYTNRPKMAARDLAGHHGFSEIVFSEDGQTARGEYFNGRGRNTFGTYTLTRETL